MRTVLHISPDIRLVSGRTKSVFNYLNRLKKSGYNVILLTNGGDSINLFEKSGIKVLVSHIQYRSYSPITLYKWVNYLKGIVTNNNVEIVHTHHRYFEYLVYLLLRQRNFRNIKSVTTVHSYHTKKPVFPRFPSEVIIAVSGSVKEHLVNVHKVREDIIRVIHNCIDLPKQSQVLKKENEIPVLLSAGWFSHEKGFDIAFKALKRVRNKFRFVLVGTGPDENELKEMAGKTGSNVNIERQTEDISEYFLSSDICIIPSRSEGLSYVALEAGKYFLPVIASDTGGIPEIIINNKTGILFNSGDSIELANKIDMLIENPGLRKELAANLHFKVKNEFNENIFGEKLLNLYNTLQ